jgi:hypothetical protein
MSFTYSFQDVQASLVGVGGVVNLANGAAVAEEGITIAMATEKSTMTIGADGEGMHSLHANKSGTVTIRLLKTSPVNAQLMALYDAQTLNSAAHGSNVITVTNPLSGDVNTCRNCAFKKKPDMVYAKEGGMNEWTFEALKIDTVLGLYQ